MTATRPARLATLLRITLLTVAASACEAGVVESGPSSGERPDAEDAAPGGTTADTGAGPGPGPGAPDGGVAGAFRCDAATQTCFDPASGLTWEHPPGSGALAWAPAKAYCAQLQLDGGGWRLPRIQELRSLVRGCPNTEVTGACMATDPTCTYRACMAGCDQCPSTIVNGERPCFWPEPLGGECDAASWSQTAYADSVDPGAWYVDFGNGAFVHGWLASQALAVRCVR